MCTSIETRRKIPLIINVEGRRALLYHLLSNAASRHDGLTQLACYETHPEWAWHGLDTWVAPRLHQQPLFPFSTLYMYHHIPPNIDFSMTYMTYLAFLIFALIECCSLCCHLCAAAAAVAAARFMQPIFFALSALCCSATEVSA